VHEYHIVKKIIEEVLAKDNNQDVIEISLCASQSSGLDPDSIRLYFEDIRQEHPCLRDSELKISLVKVKLHCPKCNLDFERQQKDFSCPICSCESERSASQKEIYVDKLVFRP